jgi:REP element-mobilizing transposase RayT
MIKYDAHDEGRAGVPPDMIKRHRRLPHWFCCGATYFVTFRLADSVPQSVLQIWRQEQEDWLLANTPPRDSEQEGEFRNRFDKKRQAWLDAGHGSCVLRNPAVSKIVAESLHFFDATRYALGDYVVMPNHVHLLVTPHQGYELSGILHSWKSYSAKTINRHLNRAGKLWQEESYDHIVRSAAQLEHFRRYIAANPVKAGLRPCEYQLRVFDFAEDKT